MPVDKLTPERRRQLTRDALIDAAGEVFARKGFSGASMEEIAAEAGFTRGAIYSNFGSKEDLLVAVLDRFTDQQLLDVAGGIQSDDPVRGALDAGAAFTRTISLELIPLELELRLNALRNPELRQRLAAADRRMGDKMARFIEEHAAAHGHRLRMPARDLADLARGAIQGLLNYAAVDEEQADHYESLIQALFVLFAEAALEPRPER